MNNESIFVILVNYKQVKLTIDCIDSIKKSSICDIKVIVVDNNSEDGSDEFLKQYYFSDNSVICIQSKCNNGFASGNNLGIKYALNCGADYVMLLNNDTIIAPTMIEELKKASLNKYVTVPKTFYFENKNLIWYAGGTYSKITGSVKHLGYNQIDNEKYTHDKFVSFGTGCCLFIPRTAIEQVGCLSEKYFMYGEDLDYSIKLNRNGFKIKYVANAHLWHKVGASSPNSKLNIYYDTRNRLMIFNEFDFFFTAKLLFLIKCFLLYVRGIQKKSNDRYFLKAIKDYHKHVEGKVNLD